MTQKSVIFKRDVIELARQHKDMRAKYPAYLAFLQWLDDKIVVIDSSWYRMRDEDLCASQFRGQRLALDEVRTNLQRMLDMDLEAEIGKLEAESAGGQV